MSRIGIRIVVLAVATGVAVAPAVAQVNDRLAAMARAFVDDNDFAPVVGDYGVACMTPILQALPDAAKQIVAAAPDIDAGAFALDAAAVVVEPVLFVRLEPCVSTMFVGDQAWNWIQTTMAGATAARQTEIAVCLMEAVAPLSGEAKQRIVLSPDFPAGVAALVAERPDLAGDVQTRVQACL
jgi:hypothetical protein